MTLKLSTRNLLRLNQPIDPAELSPVSRQRSSSVSSLSLPSFHEPKHNRSWRAFLRSKLDYRNSSNDLTRRRAYINRGLLVLLILCILASIAVGIWYALVLALIRRLSPSTPSNGLQSITTNWRDPTDSVGLLSPWPQDFSRDILPVQCHSHNDYWRKVPLYDALAAGCVGVEADLYLRHDENGKEVLLVGHSSKSLTPQRTFNNLYLDPLLQILETQNRIGSYEEAQNQTRPVGIFDTDANATVVLLLDFKSDSKDLFTPIMDALEPLRSKGYLTTWTSSTNTIIPGPLTIVASGNARYEDITSNTTYHDMFLDAPLSSISDSKYNITNSYYASISLKQAVGYLWGGKFSSSQLQTVKGQIKAASDKGLKARYWDTVSWPISWRNDVWRTLMDEGTGMLNVDDLESGAKWNWNFCVVAGFVLC